jgi:aspartyl-tRNA(Asn)/glutamyl-tRNA(Gln) amidotransferase subunit B
MAYIMGNTGKWEYVIGLEVHAQVISNSKLFSGSSTEFGASTNTQVDLFDAAMPGTLPMLNEHCVHQAIKTGIALNATINKTSIFDRKNYFYPDLPSGYQITQFYHPIVQNGYIVITLEDGSHKTIKINRLHLEQDAGKSIHDQIPDSSLIDLNRAGVALMEIVTDPELRSPYEAAEYVKKLRAILRSIGTCDGDMEKGSMRCDANVSVRKKGEQLGTRCEIKNLNSMKNIIKAIEFEAARQVELLEQGGAVLQETRLFDDATCETRSMRLKGDALDYRYFPDPDLLPVIITDETIAEIKRNLPELPDSKIARYQEELGLSEYDAEVIAADEKVAQFFEDASPDKTCAKIVANWITTELFALLNKNSIAISECPIAPLQLAEMVELINNGTISGKIAKEVFQIMFETGKDPKTIVEQKGLMQVSDEGALNAIIDKVLTENGTSVVEYKNGKEKLFGHFVGLVMKESKGKANPGLVNDLLKGKLNASN